ncbi:MAG: adenylate/guanylate cyclase domain-containing protein [Rubrivivax sp.]|nr:adenylate/guanylate cyclase domain-containing protein [Rubrivivax sp.]MBK7264518.1 adenylate/guanylate cyclase domain-containing protein [Rubrivivax sp.]MBK8530026.1 adenylate/guanylate cyclase domain-containing protein [Rubrivivax sp.]
MTPDIDIGTLTMTQIIRLQNLLTQELSRRFETSAAVCFTDIAGSTAYFARFGDAVGRQLQQLHLDQLERALAAHGGRLVDTAGDGAVTFFTSAATCAAAMCMLQQDLSGENQHRARDHQLVLRIGMHWGRVLTDGVQVSGDVMNLCARIAASADPGQIRLSRDCFRELRIEQRLRCRPLGDVELKGVGRAMTLMALDWLDRERFPVAVRVRETGETIELPLQDILSFGRMDIIEGMSANDVVLSLPDGLATRQISRWHFELRRQAEGYVLRSVSTHPTVVDGCALQRGDEVAVKPGSVVSLSGVMTLDFLANQRADGTRSDETAILV